MPPTTFHHYVKIGKIKKKVPRGRKEGYYEKAYIDRMAEASELYAIQYAEEPIVFSVATDDDLAGIYDVLVSLWGTMKTLRQTWFGGCVCASTETMLRELNTASISPENAFIGTPDQIVEQMRPFINLGVDYFMLNCGGFPDLTTLEMLIEKVLPALND
jgi:alkanesulfonate monooxygenase SsuD/methylene tetrahydromethanopterin reductase-like flavin-dependent oxidoreductase (luciferase family)